MSLCFDCGCALCCDGTLYTWAPLQAEDMPILANRFDVIAEEGKAEASDKVANFRLPCRLCLNDSCSVHDERRPAICGDYTCKLVDDHESGKVSTEKACALIRNIKDLRDRLRPQMGKFLEAGSDGSFNELTGRVAEKYEKMGPDERSAVPAAMLLDLAMMRILLAKNFDTRLTKYTYQADKMLAKENAAAAPPPPGVTPDK